MDRRTLLKRFLIAAAVGGSQAATASPVSSILGAIINRSSINEEDEYFIEVEDIQAPFINDIVLTGQRFDLLKSVSGRLKRVKAEVGYANFSLISFDQALLYARQFSRIGAFPKEEIAFLEEIFYTDANKYGFFGSKVTLNMTEKVNKKEIKKIPRTGNYLFRQSSVDLYGRIRSEVGDSIVLTSGVRGIVKQMYLFITKAVHSGGNLSLASNSIAPPGHSFHGCGDFDVGKVGYGYSNFTEAFAKTAEYKKLQDLGYVKMRYHENNPFGVRFEPWHITVDSTV